MTDLIESSLDLIDYLLILAGGFVLALEISRWRSAWPRDPLRSAPIRANVLSPLWLWLALLCYSAAVLGSLALVMLYAPAGVRGPILDARRTILAGIVMQSVVILASLWILSRTFVAGLRGAGLGRNPLTSDLQEAVKGFLMVFSLSTLVAWATEILIRALAPAYEQPRHTVFETLEHPETPRLIAGLAVGGAFFLAPWAEELLFRGIFQTGLHRIVPSRPGSLRHRWIAIMAASLIFGLMHTPMIQHIPALVVLALILGYQYERTGSLVVPILVHMLFNGKSLLWHSLLA